MKLRRCKVMNIDIMLFIYFAVGYFLGMVYQAIKEDYFNRHPYYFMAIGIYLILILARMYLL